MLYDKQNNENLLQLINVQPFKNKRDWDLGYLLFHTTTSVFKTFE